MRPLVIIDAVGLTPGLVGEHTPRIAGIAGSGGVIPMSGVLPAVTCSAQATMLTGKMPTEHGVVGNGWLYRDTNEIRFWQQSRSLMEGITLYDEARIRAEELGEKFTCAKLFWWFNQGASVDWSVTPKPHYGCDGSKAFDIYSNPPELSLSLVKKFGSFPFHAFWGPGAGAASTRWIAKASAYVIRQKRPTLSLVYLPHLDYDMQRFGDKFDGLPACLRELDDCAGRVIDAAKEIGAAVMIVSEYGITKVDKPVHINRILRVSGLLEARNGPFGEVIDIYRSRAFAVSDHQVAHVYVRDPDGIDQVRNLLLSHDSIGDVLGALAKRAHGLYHSHAGELVALAKEDAWFTYYYWMDERHAPDFASTVDIHRKPGYDPCEMFFNPKFSFPGLRVAYRFMQKKLGFRTRFDVISQIPQQICGSHGLINSDPDNGPVFICDADGCPDFVSMTDIFDFSLNIMGLA